MCDYGYNGDGISYCDGNILILPCISPEDLLIIHFIKECGVVKTTSNIRIVGGIDSGSFMLINSETK